MIQSTLIIRSTVSTQLMRKTLFQGFSIAFAGILALVAAAIFIPLPEMNVWGGFLFLMSLALITLGLLPYRRLSRLQMKPDELILVESDHLTYTKKGKKILTLPLQSVAHIQYIPHPENYGIAVSLKSFPVPSVVVHQMPKEIEKLRCLGNLNGQADLFFPYFNERAFNEWIDWQKEENEDL